MQLKICKTCKGQKKLEDFGVHPKGALGRKPSCKLCTAAYEASRRSKNPKAHNLALKKYRESNKEYFRLYSNKRRALKRQNGFSPYSEAEVLNTYGSNCHICLKEIDLNASRWIGRGNWKFGFHIDHVRPISKNGADCIENVRPSHAICNLKKSNK